MPLVRIDSTLREAVPWKSCAGGTLAFSAWRWQLCLRAFRLEVSGGKVLRLTLAGHAAGLSGLGAAGVDVTRGGLLARDRGTLGAVAASVALDHTVATPTMVIITAAALHALNLIPSLGVLTAWLACGVLVFILIGQIVRRVRPAFHARVHRMLADPAWRRATLAACLVSVPVVALQCGIFVCTARAVGVQASLIGLAGTAAAADAVAALPVSVAGLGVREQAFAVLLGKWFHVPASQAVALSVAGWAALALWAVAGVGCLLSMRAPASSSAGS